MPKTKKRHPQKNWLKQRKEWNDSVTIAMLICCLFCLSERGWKAKTLADFMTQMFKISDLLNAGSVSIFELETEIKSKTGFELRQEYGKLKAERNFVK